MYSLKEKLVIFECFISFLGLGCNLYVPFSSSPLPPAMLRFSNFSKKQRQFYFPQREQKQKEDSFIEPWDMIRKPPSDD